MDTKEQAMWGSYVKDLLVAKIFVPSDQLGQAFVKLALANLEGNVPPPTKPAPMAEPNSGAVTPRLCTIHNEPMSQAVSKKTNKTYWYHKVGTETCFGH